MGRESLKVGPKQDALETMRECLQGAPTCTVSARKSQYRFTHTVHHWHLTEQSMEMDFEKQVRIVPRSTNSAAQAIEVSLFDAVRKWKDAERTDAYCIELDGKRLTKAEIQKVSHSEAYKDRLLAFNERLA